MGKLLKFAFDTYCELARTVGDFWPILVVWEPTAKCNLQCYMCTYYGKEGIKPDTSKELDTEHAKAMLFNIARRMRPVTWPMKPYLGITGGEPFIRQDLIELLRYAKSVGFNTGVTTNATLLNENKIIELSDCVDQIKVSLDYHEEIKSKIHGTQGTFKKVIENIKLLKRYEIPTSINCVILKENIDHLVEIANLALELGVLISFQHQIFTNNTLIKAQGAVTEKLFGQSIQTWLNQPPFNKEQIKKLSETISIMGREGITFEPAIKPKDIVKYYSDLNWTRKKHCSGPFASIRIDCAGNVYPCFDYCLGNAVTEDFKKIWKGKNTKHFLKQLKQQRMFPGCKRCCKL